MNTDEYLDLISREPLPNMICEGTGYRYIKKSVLKSELRKIYGGNTKFEVTDKVVSKNGLYGTGLFHYLHPVSEEWLFESGMAAIPHTKSMRLNYPLLKAQIFKNCVREIGPWFGETLNLDIDDTEPEEVAEDVIASTDEIDKEFESVKNKLSKIKFREEAQEYLATTGFHLNIVCKNLVNNKPLKNEK